MMTHGNLHSECLITDGCHPDLSFVKEGPQIARIVGVTNGKSAELRIDRMNLRTQPTVGI